jgi:predicted transcriptional regulator
LVFVGQNEAFRFPKIFVAQKATLLHSRTLLRAGLLDSVENSGSARGKTSFAL